MTTDIIKDLSTLTTISEATFIKLLQKVEWCINDSIDSAIKNNEDTCEINLGLGTLIIKLNNDSVKYKFLPSSSLEKSISNTIIQEQNNLKLTLESSLVNKLQGVYKDFF